MSAQTQLLETSWLRNCEEHNIMDMIKELIVKIVNDKQGCKLAELSVTLAETLFNNKNHKS